MVIKEGIATLIISRDLLASFMNIIEFSALTLVILKYIQAYHRLCVWSIYDHVLLLYCNSRVCIFIGPK